MNERESIIRKWLRGELSEKEQEDFDNSPDFHLLNNIDKALSNFKAPDYQAEHPKTNTHRKPQKSLRKNRKFYYGGIAASIMIIAIAAVLWMSQPVQDQIVISSADKEFIYLPDSSIVTLNKLSTIAYDRQEWTDGRELSLDGEAFFQVEKGSRFTVSTTSGQVSVLGTKFNVTAREDYFEVTCYEGSVAVTADSDQRTLKAGETFRKLAGIVSSPALVGPSQELPGWIVGETTFKSLPLSQVIKKFERQYDIKIKVRDIDINSIISGSFAHDDMEVAIKGIAIPLDCRYKIAKRNITLFR